MAEERDNSWKGLAHVKLVDLVGSPQKIEQDAKKAGHTGSLATPVVAQPEVKVEETTKKNGNPPLVPQKGVRGRGYLFRPTGEKVTVVRERVGCAYDQSWIHEVIARDGKKFLASTKQLVDPV